MREAVLKIEQVRVTPWCHRLRVPLLLDELAHSFGAEVWRSGSIGRAGCGWRTLERAAGIHSGTDHDRRRDPHPATWRVRQLHRRARRGLDMRGAHATTAVGGCTARQPLA
jgi:hypothetical protein